MQKSNPENLKFLTGSLIAISIMATLLELFVY